MLSSQDIITVLKTSKTSTFLISLLFIRCKSTQFPEDDKGESPLSSSEESLLGADRAVTVAGHYYGQTGGSVYALTGEVVVLSL